MESYVERWAREQKTSHEEMQQKEGVSDGGTEKAQNEREGQKAQKNRRVRKKQSEESTESKGE